MKTVPSPLIVTLLGVVFAATAACTSSETTSASAPAEIPPTPAAPAEPLAAPHETPPVPVADATWDKPGFVTIAEDGRLWVFRAESEGVAQFRASGEPAQHVVRPGAGPGGMTIKGADADVITAYLVARPGFVTRIADGRLWVFRPDSDELADFERVGEPAQFVVRPLAGPLGMTVKAPDASTLEEYLTAKPGFVTFFHEGRLWVFRDGSDALLAFERDGEPATSITRPGAGPRGLTVRAPDRETLESWFAAAEGFVTFVDDGRIWVFRPGSADLATYLSMGEPAQQVIRPGAGPLNMTVKAPDTDTVTAYLRAVGS